MSKGPESEVTDDQEAKAIEHERLRLFVELVAIHIPEPCGPKCLRVLRDEARRALGLVEEEPE